MIWISILFAALTIVFGYLYLRARGQASLTIQRNTAIEQENQVIIAENQQLVEANDELRGEWDQLNQLCYDANNQLESTKQLIKVQENILQSYRKTSESLEQDAQKRAQERFEAAAASLDKEYEQRKKDLDSKYEKDSQLLLTRIQQEQAKLKDLEDKQLAYVQAKQREEEIAAKKDYYRMVIDDEDLGDITLLRNIQVQLRKKDAIDKVIYETYYRQAYDLLMSHIFESTAKICGIYKITNLENGQAYIGQSVDIRERFRQHIKSSLTSGPTTNKLYQQMKKYGPENFTFEILEIVDRGKLNERETYWIDFYKTKEYGLNGTRGGA